MTSSAVATLNVIESALSLLERRGVTHEYGNNREFINIRTINGVVQYYPLTGTYKHGVLHGYAENTESMIAYAAKQGVAKPKGMATEPITETPFDEMTYNELAKTMPIERLRAIEFDRGDAIEEIEHKQWLYKQYGLAIRRYQNMLQEERNKYTPLYLLIKERILEINSTNAALKKKYPFISMDGQKLGSFILDCLQEDVSDEVWKSYVARGKQKMLDNFFKEVK